MLAQKVVLDVDTGIDDAVAIILAARSPELEVIGVTTVAGNAELIKTTQNSLRIIEFLGSNIPVIRGMGRPLVGELKTAQDIHGESGLGEADLPEPTLMPQVVHAVDFIIGEVDSLGEELTIIATGPLTNIAMAILKQPKIMSKVGGIVSMGGAFELTPYGFGNVTPVAEFNILTDPLAANIVYHSGIEVAAVGLDVTMNPQACVDESLYHEIASANTPTAKLFTQMFGHLANSGKPIPLHDPLAVSYVIDPSLVKTKTYPVEVEIYGGLTRGQTIADKRDPLLQNLKGANVNASVDVDGPRFLNLVMRRVIYEEHRSS
jgi:inosine-uridine nucleoside N-ribohydrolase